MPNAVTAHVKTVDKGVMLREHETMEQAVADAAKSNSEAEALGVKARFEAAEGPFPR